MIDAYISRDDSYVRYVMSVHALPFVIYSHLFIEACTIHVESYILIIYFLLVDFIVGHIIM